MRKLLLGLMMLPILAMAQGGATAETTIFATIFMWLGVAASILGGLWAVFSVVAKATPTQKDDEFKDKVESRALELLEKLPDELEQKIKDAFNDYKK